MLSVLRAWLRDLRDPHVPLSSVLRETRTKLADTFREPHLLDQIEALRHEGDALTMHGVATRQAENERRQKAQPGNRVVQIRSVRS